MSPPSEAAEPHLDPALLADTIVVVHLGIVVFVVVGELLVLLGGALRWSWVRGMVFRSVHLAVVLFVALEGAFGVLCPLTRWEHDLRVRAGQTARNGSFVGRLAHDLLFVDVPLPVLNACYVAFGVLVLASLVLVRPRRRHGLADRPTPR